MGKKSNQRFVQIPHSQLMDKLDSMCERYGIKFVRQEESYTSKASFLENDEIPSFDEEEEEHNFSGKRVKRGLYKKMNNIFVHADINAAANVLRKSKHTIEFDKVCRGLLAVPMTIKLA